MKREPREFSHSHYDDYEERDDRSSHRPSRPSSRAGSISFHDMSNMSMSSQQQWAAMQQAMLQEQYRQQQMMMMNPLQYQVNQTFLSFLVFQTKRYSDFVLVKVLNVGFCWDVQIRPQKSMPDPH